MFRDRNRAVSTVRVLCRCCVRTVGLVAGFLVLLPYDGLRVGLLWLLLLPVLPRWCERVMRLVSAKLLRVVRQPTEVSGLCLVGKRLSDLDTWAVSDVGLLLSLFY